MKNKELKILFILSTILFTPSLIHLTTTENAGGFRYKWYEGFKYVFNGNLYSSGLAFTGPLVFVFGAILYNILPWSILFEIFILLFYLISMATIYFLYKIFQKEKYSYIFIPFIYFYFPPQDFALNFSIFFFALGLFFKNNPTKQALMFSLSSLSKQIMLVPVFLFMIFYNNNLRIKDRTITIDISVIKKQLMIFFTPWILILVFFGFRATMDQLFLVHLSSKMRILEWIFNYSQSHYITRDSSIFAFPTIALLGILLVHLYRKMEFSRENAIIFLSLLFIIISQSKTVADPYFSITTPIFMLLFFKNKRLRPYLLAILILYYFSYIQIYSGQIFMSGIARIDLNIFNNIVVENMVHQAKFPSPILFPKNVFETLQSYELLEDKASVTNILFGDGGSEYELHRQIFSGQCAPIFLTIYGWNCDECRVTSAVCYINSQELQNSANLLAQYYNENLQKICEYSPTIFYRKVESLRNQGILNYQGICSSSSDIFKFSDNLKRNLYKYVPIFSIITLLVFIWPPNIRIEIN